MSDATSDEQHDRDEIIVVRWDSELFRVAIVHLNQRHRLAGDIDNWISQPMPLELANDLAIREGTQRRLPTTIWTP